MGEYTNMSYEDIDNLTRQEAKQDRKINRRILSLSALYLSITAMAIILVQSLMSYISYRFFIEFYNSAWFELALSGIGMVGVGLPLFYLLMKRLPDSPRGELIKLSFGNFIGFFVVCAATMYLSNMAGSVINKIIEVIKGTNIKDPLEDVILGSPMLIRILYASIVGPIVEELMFRKILLDKLRRFGDMSAMVLTGIAFGLFHMNIWQLHYATMVGILFAYITIRTNSIRYAVLLHMMLNFIGVGASALIIASGNLIGMIVLYLWLLSSIVIGIVLFVKNLNKIEINKAEVPLIKRKDYILNLGTMIYLIICIGMMVVNILYLK